MTAPGPTSGRGESVEHLWPEGRGGRAGEHQVQPGVGEPPDAGLLHGGDHGGQPVEEVEVGLVDDLHGGRVVSQAAQQGRVVGGGSDRRAVGHRFQDVDRERAGGVRVDLALDVVEAALPDEDALVVEEGRQVAVGQLVAAHGRGRGHQAQRGLHDDGALAEAGQDGAEEVGPPGRESRTSSPAPVTTCSSVTLSTWAPTRWAWPPRPPTDSVPPTESSR